MRANFFKYVNKGINFSSSLPLLFSACQEAIMRTNDSTYHPDEKRSPADLAAALIIANFFTLAVGAFSLSLDRTSDLTEFQSRAKAKGIGMLVTAGVLTAGVIALATKGDVSVNLACVIVSSIILSVSTILRAFERAEQSTAEQRPLLSFTPSPS